MQHISSYHRGYVPTHGPGCLEVRSYPTKCRQCSQQIIYFECSCGSRVFFDPSGQGVHDCTQGARAYRAQILIDLIMQARQEVNGSTLCPMCGTAVRNAKDRVRKHFQRCPKIATWFPPEE